MTCSRLLVAFESSPPAAHSHPAHRRHRNVIRKSSDGKPPHRPALLQAPPENLAPAPPAPSLKDIASIWVTNILQVYGNKPSYDGAPIAAGAIDDLQPGALFLALFKFFRQYGTVFKLAFGPKAFIIVSDPVVAKHVLRTNAGAYDKGLLAEILEPIMGKGLIPADFETWKARRRAIVPAFHAKWMARMATVFTDGAAALGAKLAAADARAEVVDMEAAFCSLALDVIGKSVFNYDFGSLVKQSPVIRAVYNTLQEAEHRSTFYLPYWNLPLASVLVPRQRRFQADLALINTILDDLIAAAVSTRAERPVEDLQSSDYTESEDPSLLRFLVDVRGEAATSRQLRDDLMTMLIAGHETVAAVLTWAAFSLSQHPEHAAAARVEVDAALGPPGDSTRRPSYDELRGMEKVRLIVAETLRLYPAPPVLIRRSLVADTLPRGSAAAAVRLLPGSDVMISVWNLHRSPELWEKPEVFDPTRWLRPYSNPAVAGWGGYKPELSAGLYPNEVSADFAFLPFGAGSRKCVGDQFALLEATAALAVLVHNFDFELACAPADVGYVTGATIHTRDGLPMRMKLRKGVSPNKFAA